MTCHAATCRWRQCPGCGRDRRLAGDGKVMRDHNRWDPAIGAMVLCEGSGQEPRPHDHSEKADDHPYAQRDAGRGAPPVARPDEGAA